MLNARGVAPTAGEPPELAAPEPQTPKPTGRCPACDRTESAAARVAESEDMEAIKAFILDRATPLQVEHIFTAIGVRFHELRKAVGAGK